MILKHLFLILSIILLFSCEAEKQEYKILLSDENIFVLCEGNFNAGNASLWRIGVDDQEVFGPLFRDLTGDYLGDTGQSLTVAGNQLYVVNNNSHTIEVLGLGNELIYQATIDLDLAGPRYIAVHNETGYVSCWNLNGILMIDLDSYSILDTIACGGLPEAILVHGDDIYVAINKNPDWTSANQVLRISTSTKSISDTFIVAPGPDQLLSHGNNLYVSSIAYDADYNSYPGTSVIDLTTGIVTQKTYGQTSGYGSDLVVINDLVYRLNNNGVVPLNPDLTVNSAGQIGQLSYPYSVAAIGNYLYFGVTDYSAPDTVLVLNLAGDIIQEFTVGALPGAFAAYSRN